MAKQTLHCARRLWENSDVAGEPFTSVLALLDWESTGEINLEVHRLNLVVFWKFVM